MSKHFITLEKAKEFTQRYRTSLPNMLTSDFNGALSFSETFDADAIKAILDQPGCVSFRSYFGMNEDNKVCVIFVGVNENNEDMVGPLKGAENDIIVEYGSWCPPFCSPNSL
jgi:D-lyxose ketol-isomerase